MPETEEIVQTDFEVEIQARIDAERARLFDEMYPPSGPAS